MLDTEGTGSITFADLCYELKKLVNTSAQDNFLEIEIVEES